MYQKWVFGYNVCAFLVCLSVSVSDRTVFVSVIYSMLACVCMNARYVVLAVVGVVVVWLLCADDLYSE